MQFELGTTVKTAQGDSVGKLHRVVMDPCLTNSRTPMCVRACCLRRTSCDQLSSSRTPGKRGLIYGWMVISLKSRRTLKKSTTSWLTTTNLQNAMRTSAFPLVPAPLRLPVTCARATQARSTWTRATDRAKRPGLERPLREGAQVIDVNGTEVGKVEQVLTDPERDRTTHFVISKGSLLPKEILIPMDWFRKLAEGPVELSVRAGILASLPGRDA